MVHITGFGGTGPDRGLRAYDGIIQAMSGIPELTGAPAGEPVLVGTFVADHLAAYQATLAVLFALQRRARTGKGAFVDVSMLQAYSATLAHEVGEALAGRSRPRAGNKVPTAFANTFPTADGHVYLAPLGEDLWQAFCRALDRPDWLDRLDYEAAVGPRRSEAEQGVVAWCSSRTREQVAEVMRAHGVPCGPVRTVAEAARSALSAGGAPFRQVHSPGGQVFTVPAPVAPVGLSGSPRREVVPGLGEHTQELLQELAERSATPSGRRPP